jgi:hypothetical protein
VVEILDLNDTAPLLYWGFLPVEATIKPRWREVLGRGRKVSIPDRNLIEESP